MLGGIENGVIIYSSVPMSEAVCQLSHISNAAVPWLAVHCNAQRRRDQDMEMEAGATRDRSQGSIWTLAQIQSRRLRVESP